MKTVRLLLLGSIILSISSTNSFSQVEIQNLSYWKFWSGNSPDTYSYKDSVEVISSNVDSTVFSVKQYRIGEFIGESILTYKDRKVFNTSNRDTLIFDENLKKGDTMSFEFDNYLIDSVLDTVLLDGVVRKMWRMHAIEALEINEWFFPATWIEGIGELNQGFSWNSVVSTASIPHNVAVCNGDSLLLWQPFSFPGGPDPSCDFDYLDSYLGIDEDVSNNKSLSFYPNPSDGILLFDIELVGFQYQIFDPTGKVKTSGKTKTQINVRNLNSGVYLLQIQKNNQLLTRRLIID